MRPHTTQLVVTNKLLQMDPNSAQNLDKFSYENVQSVLIIPQEAIYDDYCALEQYTLT